MERIRSAIGFLPCRCSDLFIASRAVPCLYHTSLVDWEHQRGIPSTGGLGRRSGLPRLPPENGDPTSGRDS